MKNLFIQKTVHRKIAAIAVVILIVSAVSVCFLLGGERKCDGVNLYFLDPINNNIVAEQRAINIASEYNSETEQRQIVNNLLDEIIAGPRNTTLTKILPEDVKILSCEIKEDSEKGSIAEVDFSSEYNELSESQELVSRGAITKTLTELEFIDGVAISVEGQPITRTNGETISELEKDDLEVNPAISPYRTEEKAVVLYFADEQAMGLIPEQRTIEISVKQTIESRIVEELIKGPAKESELYATIPVETKINNINTEGGICYVDLSGDFVSKHPGGSSGELLTIYSIVNSLTELENVKQVQFLIDGVKVSSLTGHVDFSKTFERKEDVILASEQQSVE